MQANASNPKPADDCWYNAFNSAPDTPAHLPAATEAAALPAAAADADNPPPGLLSLLSDELHRLARDNERLMDRIETLLAIQEREQVLRQQLQGQIDRLSERLKRSEPAPDYQAIRREAREGAAEELKPVLLAILDALERFAHRPKAANPPKPSTEDALPALDDFGKLPDILTQPLEELLREPHGARLGRANKRLLRTGRREHGAVAEAVASEGIHPPGAFTWTTVFTS